MVGVDPLPPFFNTFMVPAQFGLPIKWALIFRLKTAIFDLKVSGFGSSGLPAIMWGTQTRADGG